VHLASLACTDFRNYTDVRLELPPEGALIRGPNGSGKTNLLEAIHVLCLGRSQRGARRGQMIRGDADSCFLQAQFRHPSGGLLHDAAIGFSRDGRSSMKLDGSNVRRFRDWFNHAPVVSFGPDDLRIVTGSPGERRRFLDILISQIDPVYLEHLVQYQKTLLNRNNALSERGDETLLSVLERQLARQGSYLYKQRSGVLASCQGDFAEFYASICGGKEHGELGYKPSISAENASENEWTDVFYKALKNKRKRDIQLGYSSVGPHRDEILFLLDGKPARNYGSQGQCRSLALALRLCSALCIERHREEAMIFLVDDAFSELDDQRVSMVYPLIRSRGQVCMTTPSENTSTRIDLAEFRVVRGGTILSV
jgi:DNA replication and repair protein RecF